MKGLIVFGAVALLLQDPSLAGTPSSKAATPDPNERICEKVELIGTRLGSKRVCATRAEWAERRRQDREAVERGQLSPCVLTHSSGSGRPAC